MPTHPYAALSTRSLCVATCITAGVWAFLTLVLLWAVPLSDLGEVQRLLASRDAAEAGVVLDAWASSTVASFSFLLGFDFLYDLAHNNAVALFAVWGASRRGGSFARGLASAAGWLLWLATALNVFENLAFLHLLRAGPAGPLLSLGSATFVLRSLILVGGVIVGVLLHLPARAAPARR